MEVMGEMLMGTKANNGRREKDRKSIGRSWGGLLKKGGQLHIGYTVARRRELGVLSETDFPVG